MKAHGLGFLVVIISFMDQKQDFWTWVETDGWGPMLFKIWLTWIALVLFWKLARVMMRTLSVVVRTLWAVLLVMIAQAGRAWRGEPLS
jgi:hypothetical protein